MKSLILFVLILIGTIALGQPADPPFTIEADLKVMGSIKVIGITQDLTSGSMIVLSSDGKLSSMPLQEASDLAFDSERTILRIPEVGANIGGSTITDVFEWMYYTSPTITINISGSYPVEVGTSQTITISGTVTNYGDVLSNGAVTSAQATNNPIIYFDDAESYTSDITFAPTQGGTTDFTKLSYTFVAYVDYAGTETGYKEASATVSSVYATYWGVSETAFEESTTGTAIWTAFNSTRQIWSDINSFRSRTYTADNEYIVYAYPRSYGAPTQILNPSGFNEILGFDIWEITVTNTVTSGITNPSTDVEYYLVQSKLPMSGMTNFAYRFYY